MFSHANLSFSHADYFFMLIVFCHADLAFPSAADFQFADDADFDLFGLGICRFREILLMTCRILCFILGGFEEKAYFCGRSVKYRRN